MGTYAVRVTLKGPPFDPEGKFGNEFCNRRERLPEGCFEHESVYQAHPSGPEGVPTHQNVF